MKQNQEEKKVYLNSYREAKIGVSRLEEQLEELRLNKISPSYFCDGMPRSHKKTDLSDYAVKVDEIEQSIITARYQRIKVFESVQSDIEGMADETEKSLLTYRYLRGLKWEDICLEMGYSWKQIHRIHQTALEHFTI